MYVVVDMGVDNKILWSDTRICKSRVMANSRKEFFEKKCPNKNYKVLRFTQYKIAA
ncbi:hypothetical protein M3649_03945 [Ureibacillus chungkukjangi]|uniref:hypothetical protein n=1 Tax=Ureibacillus chungkukjangi TaxID=1202712 RepID=UPI00203F0B06|nr:hypothetical protein [Ureibacillus chungkukjangi]MCM3387284.1 hypothetical protein [Ureibacillus chungkukjangi]